MPKVMYEAKRFGRERMALIERINGIVDEYHAQGYNLTLRQVYYQLVARDVIPNNERSYKNTGALINDARLAGLIDWYAIEDRTRNLRHSSHWETPESIVASCAAQFAIDLREDQPTYIEVWVEKDALVGVVGQVCEKLDVPFFSCRGYVSQSEMWSAAMRFRHLNWYDRYVIIHLGDHDPSGKDMTRDIQARMELFEARVEVERIALNYDQIDKYSPPPNPTKLTDSRASGYIAEYGHECWELDALEPRVLTKLIRDKVNSLTDQERLQKRIDEQNKHREELELLSKNYSRAIGLLTEEL